MTGHEPLSALSSSCSPEPGSGRGTRPARWLLLAAAAAMSGCASYVEPSPGRYVDLGSRKTAELQCEYDAPTAMRIPAWSCRRTGDIPAQNEAAREVLQSLPTIQPRDP